MSEKIKVLVVGAKRNGYRRAGLQFGESAASIPLSALTSHQVKELRTDRMLTSREADAVVLLDAEHEDLQRRAAIADELVALLPIDYPWTRTPVEYVGNLVEQLRVETGRATESHTELVKARATNDALRAQVEELEGKLAAKPEAAKASHTVRGR